MGTAANAIAVSYSGDPLGLANGAVVSVRTQVYDSASSYSAASVRVRANDVSTFSQYIDNTRGTSSASNEKNELYGMVTQVSPVANGGCTLQVQGVPTTLASTALCGAIQNGDYVEVKGLFANGGLSAYRVEFKTAGTDRSLSGYGGDHDGEGLKYRRLWNNTNNASNTASNNASNNASNSSASNSGSSSSGSSS